MKGKWRAIVKKLALFITNPRLLLCFGIAWFITNGWSYVMFGFGTYLGIPWMIAVGGAYLAFLWIPFTPEKIVTVIISMFLLRLLFPKDEKTLGVLREMGARAKKRHQSKKEAKTEIPNEVGNRQADKASVAEKKHSERITGEPKKE